MHSHKKHQHFLFTFDNQQLILFIRKSGFVGNRLILLYFFIDAKTKFFKTHYFLLSSVLYILHIKTGELLQCSTGCSINL